MSSPPTASRTRTERFPKVSSPASGRRPGRSAGPPAPPPGASAQRPPTSSNCPGPAASAPNPTPPADDGAMGVGTHSALRTGVAHPRMEHQITPGPSTGPIGARLHHVARTLVLALVAGLMAAAPVVATSATVGPVGLSSAKVVIIVGATHSSTSRYRDIADSAYAEAIKYSSNVVKVYSPNATWAAVKPALH